MLMTIRIIRQPGGSIDGIALDQYRLGRRYDLPPSLAQYLVAQGFALLEMRRHVRSSRWRPTERRKHDLFSDSRYHGSAWAF